MGSNKCGLGLLISGEQENTVTVGEHAAFGERTVYQKLVRNSQWKATDLYLVLKLRN